MNPLTDRQKEVLAFIKAFLKKSGFPPTSGDIAEEFGFKSLTASTQHVRALERKGYIKCSPGVARGIRVL